VGQGIVSNSCTLPTPSRYGAFKIDDMKILALFFILTIFTNCNQINNQNISPDNFLIDTSKIAIFPCDTNLNLFKNCINTALTNEDIKEIEELLRKCIEEYNPEMERKFYEYKAKHPSSNLEKEQFTIKLSRYKRQYIAVVNSRGEKVVWINCFCNTYDNNWKENLIFVKDGGNCFFNLKVNLKTGKYYDLIVNGEA